MNYERILRIFVSSPFEDLEDVRKAIFHQVLLLDHVPTGMELFKAGDEQDLKVITRAIDNCDIYLLVVGYRYGSITSDGKSYTEVEYDISQRLKKPTLVFIMDENEVKRKRGELYSNSTDSRAQREQQNETLYYDFRSRVSQNRLRKKFKYASDITGNLSASISEVIRSHSDQISGLVHFDDVLGKMGKNFWAQELIQRLKTYVELYKRCEINEEEKKSLSKYFWHVALSPIIESECKTLFFESGSTCAFVAREFLEQIQASKNISEWSILTNNVLVYLSYSFTMITRYLGIKVKLVPEGPPENIYGASFGEIHDIPMEQAPVDHIPKRHQKLVKKVAKGINRGKSKKLILAGTSGLELSKDPTDKTNTYRVPAGPHVGDYKNMLLKRAMFKTGCPIIMFLEYEKINSPFDREHCYPIFLGSDEWESTCRNYPLAICVGCKEEEDSKKTIELLSSWGFHNIAGFDRVKFENQGFPILVYNSPFLEGTNFRAARVIEPN